MKGQVMEDIQSISPSNHVAIGLCGFMATAAIYSASVVASVVVGLVTVSYLLVSASRILNERETSNQG